MRRTQFLLIAGILAALGGAVGLTTTALVAGAAGEDRAAASTIADGGMPQGVVADASAATLARLLAEAAQAAGRNSRTDGSGG